MQDNFTQSEIIQYNQGIADSLKLIEVRSQYWNTTYDKDEAAYEITSELNKIKSSLLDLFK